MDISVPDRLGHGGDAPAAVRTITPADLTAALREGWADFLSKRGDLIFVGLIYPVVGLVAAWAALGGPLLYLLFPLAAGLSLLGPLVATGFYELARRREQGLEAGWRHFFDVERGPAVQALAPLALMLIGVFVLWLMSATAIYTAFFGRVVPTSPGAFLHALFATPNGWAMMIVGDLVGAAFAVLVLATSVVSFPMIVDREVTAVAALKTSLAAFNRNRGVLLRWGVIVGALLVVGSIPLFLGLAVTLPLLGYATWHLYTRLVERPAMTQAS